MITVSVYLLKHQRLAALKTNNCWGVDLYGTDEYTLFTHFEITSPNHTEYAIPLNGRERKLTYKELEEKYDWFHATMILDRRRLTSAKSQSSSRTWEFYQVPTKEASDALMLLMNIIHGFEPETLALLYVNHQYVIIQETARNIINYGKDSVLFVYNKGLKDGQEVKEHFKVKDKEQ